MGDAGKFSNEIIYWAFNISCIVLMLSELVLLITTYVRGYKKNKDKSDYGSMWLIIIGFWSCFYIASFFRSIRFKDTIGKWLLPDAFSYIGVCCIILGMLIRWIAIITLNRAFTFSVQTASEQHLITEGMYGVVRNPAYSGSILSIIGVTLAMRNILSLIVVIIILTLCYGIRIHVEEKALHKAFGKEFEDYCSKTKRVIPYVL